MKLVGDETIWYVWPDLPKNESKDLLEELLVHDTQFFGRKVQYGTLQGTCLRVVGEIDEACRLGTYLDILAKIIRPSWISN